MKDKPTIAELEKMLENDMARVVINPDGSIGTKIQFLLDTANVNEIVLASILKVLKRSRGAHFTNITMRISGKDEEYEVDWLKYLEFDESQFGLAVSDE